jgi:hypothetical protein
LDSWVRLGRKTRPERAGGVRNLAELLLLRGVEQNLVDLGA